MQQFLGCNAEAIANTIYIIPPRVKTPVYVVYRTVELMWQESMSLGKERWGTGPGRRN